MDTRKGAAEIFLRTKEKLAPTIRQFSAYQAAFDYFNKELFEGELPYCILNFSRKSKAVGFFAPERWKSDAQRAHEISLNPDHLTQLPESIFSTLVHEMVHLWRYSGGGKPPAGGYHDRHWAKKMEEIGLMPSATGQPGGKKTGKKMGDYVVAGGRFRKALEAMPRDILLPWLSGNLSDEHNGDGNSPGEGEPKPPKKRDDKLKFSCVKCGQNAWGKRALRLLCGKCLQPFVCEAEELLEREEQD